MRYEFRLPDVGEGISEGEILGWLVAAGDTVDEGDPIAEISTDKVTLELPSPCAGTIVELPWPVHAVVPVGEVLVVIDRAEIEAASGNGPEPATTGPSGTIAPRPGPTLGRVVAAPSTRRFALEAGVDLRDVRGSGPGGRILRRDVEATLGESRTGDDMPSPPPPAQVPRTDEATRERLSGARAAAAKHMAASSHTTATATTTFEVFGDGILELSRVLGAEAERRSVRLTPVAVIAKCAAAALARHPHFNATVEDATGDLLLHPSVDLGVAVAAPNGLLVPVVRDVQSTTLLAVAERIADLATRAREGRLGLDELRGGTFTLSSTGSLERATIVSTTPLLNLPQTAILWTSRIGDRPRVRDGVLEAGPVMVCSLSFDHRYIDGAMATAFINDLVAYLERPEAILA